jgi:Mg2+/Co2+ transporter CorC
VLVRKIADFFITLIIGKERPRGNIITEDMVRILAREAVVEGALDHLEAQFINRIFDFGNKTLEDVMTPRSDIFFLHERLNLEEAVHAIKQTRHTKIPVYEDNRDNIIGILYARGLLALDMKKESQGSPGLIKFLKPPYFVPESKTVADLFKTFRERKLSIALTVDEYGGITGLVTMEDLLECIFGEIYSPSDEFDKPGLKKISANRYQVDGSFTVSDFNAGMESRLSDEFGKTVGGIILHSFGEIPEKGSLIELDNFRFTVMNVEANRIKTLEFEQIEKVSDSQPLRDDIIPGSEPDDSDQGAEKAKDAALFPVSFSGRWAMIHRPVATVPAKSGHIWISFSPDLRHWGDHRMLIPSRGGGWWDANKIGLSPPPLETDEGWLILYHGVRMTASAAIYRLGPALLDLDDPCRVIARSDPWVFAPEADYEIFGDVDKVVFPCGRIRDGDTVRLYYGAADTCIALAEAYLPDLLAWLKQHNGVIK